ncbi:MAG TPA: Gfo/Idh/MocA family oxidoreductase [Candidatus Binatia bacterium]|nr:Gfo/Idh/MocA family oxidoreductase [Candidatus Binatia bacterium]
MSGAPIPVGVVGAGKHGERYIRHIHEDVPELSVRLLCRRDLAAGRAQAERLGARYLDDFRALVASPEIAAVIAVVPPTLNVEICTTAAQAGKAILVEKPLAPTVTAALEIRRAVGAAGVPCMVAHTLRFNSVVRAVRNDLGKLGALHQLSLTQRFEPSLLDWLDDPRVSGGGNLLHTGVHSFDLVRFLTGDNPRAVRAETRRVVTRQSEDNFAAVFSFSGPLLAAVSGSRATASRSGAIEVAGEHGEITADHVHGFAYRVSGAEREPLDVPPPVPTVRETLRAFARMLRGDPLPSITLEDGLWSVAMAEACYRSAESGKTEAVVI